MSDEEIDQKIDEHSLNSVPMPPGYIVMDVPLALAILGEWQAGDFDDEHWVARTFIGLIQLAGG